MKAEHVTDIDKMTESVENCGLKTGGNAWQQDMAGFNWVNLEPVASFSRLEFEMLISL